MASCYETADVSCRPIESLYHCKFGKGNIVLTKEVHLSEFIPHLSYCIFYAYGYEWYGNSNDNIPSSI